MGLIVTRAPFRISFAGGGTDLPAFYEKDYGAVLSTTIDKHVYVMVNQRDPIFGRGVSLLCSPSGKEKEVSPIPFDKAIRVSYSTNENVAHANQIKHPIVREVLLYLGIDEPVDINTASDIPAGTGLGSSSTFTVALLHAMHTFKNEEVDAHQLAEEAAHIEIERLGRPCGKQDHYAAAYGGLKLFRFNSDHSSEVEDFPAFDPSLNLFKHLMLFYTNIQRPSSDILSEQKKNSSVNKFSELSQIRDAAFQVKELLNENFDAQKFGQIIHESWLRKKTLASGVSSPQVDNWYQLAQKAGAWGGKICGAGGGGFLMLVAPQGKKNAIREALRELPEMKISYAPQGSSVVFKST